LVFLFPATNNLAVLRWGVFVVGLATIAQFSFWGNYLPRVYPTYLRGTGESFAANIGGRMLRTGGSLVTAPITSLMPGASPMLQLAHGAGIAGVTSSVVALGSSRWLPEPR